MIPTSWTYLREMVQTLNNIKHVDNNFRISSSILNPKYVFEFFQRSNKMNLLITTLASSLASVL